MTMGNPLWLLSSQGFVNSRLLPHGTCLVWKQNLIWLHAASDALITLSYYSIPVGLLYFAHKRHDLEYRWMFSLFAAFIFACGSTHLMDIWTLWHPDYLVQGVIKCAAAVVSTATAVLLWPLIPRALEIPSRTALTESNRRLQEEIAQRERTEAVLRQGEELWRRFVEYAPLPVAMFDNAMRYLGHSQRWLTDFGLSANVLGQCHYDVFPDLPARWKDAHRRGLAGEVLSAEEDRIEGCNGQVHWRRWALQPWLDHDGRIGGIILFAENITERKALEDERKKFVQLVERSSDFIAMFDAAGRLSYLNAAGRQMTGAEDLEGASQLLFQDLIAPDKQAHAFSTLGELHDQAVWQEELTFCHLQTGTLRQVQCSIFSLPDPVLGDRHFGTVTRDISLQKQASALLAQSEADMRQLIDALPVLVAYIDKNERYRTVNKTYEQWYQRPCSEVEGASVREITGDYRYEKLQPYILQALGGEPVTFDVSLPYPDGKMRFIRSTCMPDICADGIAVGMFTVVEDLTEIHHTTEALRLARDNTEREVQLRTLELQQANAALEVEIAERRRTEKALTATAADLAEAQRVAHIGNWRYDVATKDVQWSDELYLVFDVAPNAFEGVYAAFLARIHPDDQLRVSAVNAKMQTEGGSFDIEYRIVVSKGRIKTIREVGYAETDGTGRITGLFGTAMDITERRAAEEARLADAVAQRQLLVREVHHRIKNHLQGLVGLLGRFESQCVEAAPYFQQAAAQTNAIATIHGLQAQCGNEECHLASVIAAIIDGAQQLTDVPIELRRIGPTLEWYLEEKSSVAIALVINELVLNAIKHGRYDMINPRIEAYIGREGNGFWLRIVNPGSLSRPAGMQPSTGLGLARLLLPRDGASLFIESQTDRVEATLHLTTPVLACRPAQADSTLS